MSCHLSKDLKNQYHVRAIPVRKDDEVLIVRGSLLSEISIIGNNKGKKGKVLQVYRRRWALHVEKITKDKANGTQVQVPIHPSNCTLITLKLDKDRKKLLERKKVVEKGKGKYKAGQVDMGLD